jgi:hypothetical protein
MVNAQPRMLSTRYLHGHFDRRNSNASMLRCEPDDAPTLNFDAPVALTRYDRHRLHEKRQEGN